VTETPEPAPAVLPAVADAPARGQAALAVVFLVLIAGLLALYRTTDRPLFTSHEARAGLCARNMLGSAAWPAELPSPWLVPQFSAAASPELNYQKPPLYYWAVAGASAVAGNVTRLTVRLPSAVSFILLVLCVYGLGRTLVSHRTGLVAALVLASTPKVLWWGRAAVLDPMLAACIAGALLFFVRAHLGPRRGDGLTSPEQERGVGAWQIYLFWALAGLGTLVKATALVVPLLTVGLYLVARSRADGLWRPLARLKPVTGPLVLLLVAAPWHVAAHMATDGAFSRIYWGVHVFGRATGTSVFENTTAPWYYLPVMARDLFPWVVFLPGALVQVWRRRSRAVRGRLLFPLVWFVGSLAFFSAVSFRKDEYLLVTYPAAALLVGYFLDYYVEAQMADAPLRKWVMAAFVIVALAAVAEAASLLALGFWPAARDGLLAALENRTDRVVLGAVADLLARRAWLVLLLAGPMVFGAGAAMVWVVRRRAAGAFAMTLCTTLLAFVLFVEAIVPVMGTVRSLAEFGDAVEAAAVRRDPKTRVLLAVGECHELAFVLGDRAETLRAHPEVTAFIRAERAAGRPWMVVMARRDYDRRHWDDPAIAWQVVAETRKGHRRPMVCVEPDATDYPRAEARGRAR